MPSPDEPVSEPAADAEGEPEAADAVEEWLRKNMTWLVLAGALVMILLPRVSPFEGLNNYLNVFQRLSEWTIARLQSLFADYGYYVVFFGVLMENSMLLGLLSPGTIVLILAGLSAQNGSINLPAVVALGIAGAVLGDTISYALGRLGWTKVFERFGLEDMLDKVRRPMETNRRWILFGYHFAGYSRAVGPIAAGIFRIPYRKWAPFDHAGATVWVIAYVTIGVVLGLFGLQFGDTRRMANFIEIFFTGLLIVAIAGVVWREYRTQQREKAAAPVPVTSDDE